MIYLMQQKLLPRYNKCYLKFITHLEEKTKESHASITWLNKDYHSKDADEISFIINGNLYLVRIEYINGKGFYHTDMTRAEFLDLCKNLKARACYMYIECDDQDNYECKLDGWGLVDPYTGEQINPDTEPKDLKSQYTDWELHNLAIQNLIDEIVANKKQVVNTTRVQLKYPHLTYANSGNGLFIQNSFGDSFSGIPTHLVIQALRFPDTIGTPINGWGVQIKRFRDTGANCQLVNVIFQSQSGNFYRNEKLTYTTFNPEEEFLTNPVFSDKLGNTEEDKSELALYKNICNDQYHEILRLREIEQKYDEAIRQNEITFNQNNSISTDENINTKILYQLSIGSDSTGNNILNATECLKIINTLAPDRIIILKEAWKSAKEIDSDFKNTNTLIKLLARLTTSFYDELQKPGGNPRSVFTSNEYAANESNSTTNSDKLQKQREFLFDNRKLQMNSHLKIGTSDNINFTIRVHFCFDSPTQKVIIGWCGKHLNISSR